MSNYSIEGTLVKIFPEENRSANFTTRDFVIEVAGQYPQMVKFQLVQDRVSAIDSFTEGDQVTVHFDLRGREWQGKYFTNLQAWKVEGQSAAITTTTTQHDTVPLATTAPPMGIFVGEPEFATAAREAETVIGAENEPDSLPF
jgi:single-strand DNA-binding protein